MKCMFNALTLLVFFSMATAVCALPVHAGDGCPLTKADYGDMAKAVHDTDKYKQCEQYCQAAYSKNLDRCPGTKHEQYCRDCMGGFYKKCNGLCREEHGAK